MLAYIGRRFGRRCGTLCWVIVMQPVLEIYAPGGFALWPVAEGEPFRYLTLSGELTTAEVETSSSR